MKKQTAQRLVSLFLAMALLCLGLPMETLSVTAVSDGKNLVVNGDFESGNTNGWNVWDAAAKSNYAYNGRYGMGYTGSDWRFAKQEVPVERNTGYRLSFWYKGGLALYVKGNGDIDNNTFWGGVSGGLPMANGYTYVSFEINSGGFDLLYIEFSTNGAAWCVDDVVLELVSLPPETGYIANGDFETGTLDGWQYGNVTTVSKAAAKDGNYGASVTSGNGQWDEYAALYTAVPVEKNTDYVLRFDHMSASNSCVIVYIKNADKTVDIVSDWPGHAPGCWSREQYHFNSGDNDTINIQLCVGAKNATRYFDNISLTKVMGNTIGGGLSSVMETDDGLLGLAFQFTAPATVQVEEPYTFVSGTIDPYGDGSEYELVRMGAVVTNQKTSTQALTLEAVNGKTCVDIPAVKVYEAEEGATSFAVRITNIPANAKGVMLHARPYCVYRNKGEEVVWYASSVYSESYNSVMDRLDCAAGEQWELYWSDEFGGDELDETKWDASIGKANSGDTAYYKTDRSENVRVENGNLVLTARNENVADAGFTTGYVSSGEKFSFLYGRLEFRVKMPYGKGVWPALWTLGDYYLTTNDTNGWPYGGEIDILELVGESNTDPYEIKNRTTSHNLHWGYDRNTHLELGSYKTAYNNHYELPADVAPSQDYHIYAIEWEYRSVKFFVDDVQVGHVMWGSEKSGWFGSTKDYIAWYDADGNQIKKITSIDAYDDNGNKKSVSVSCDDLDFAFSSEENPHWLIMNIGLCEGWGEMTNKVDGGSFPQEMCIDYVRVYKKK